MALYRTFIRTYYFDFPVYQLFGVGNMTTAQLTIDLSTFHKTVHHYIYADLKSGYGVAYAIIENELKFFLIRNTEVLCWDNGDEIYQFMVNASRLGLID